MRLLESKDEMVRLIRVSEKCKCRIGKKCGKRMSEGGVIQQQGMKQQEVLNLVFYEKWKNKIIP